MEDISREISRAISEGSIKSLIEKYNADLTLSYSVSDVPVFISADAYYKNLGKGNSLEHICFLSKKHKSPGCLAIEFPGTGLFDKKTLTITRFIVGDMGDTGGCDWDSGDLLEKSYLCANSSGAKVVLGHTHPVFGAKNRIERMYGAIPSKIPYKSAVDVRRWVRDEAVAKKIVQSGMYKKHGGDFIETIARAELFPEVSHFSWILSPYLNQFGIFEVRQEDKVIYHPWVVRDKD